MTIYFDKDYNAYGFEIPNPIASVDDETWVIYAPHPRGKTWDIRDGAFIPLVPKAQIQKAEQSQQRIRELKILLQSTDYQQVKHSEGVLSDEEYEPIRLQRQLWRQEINLLQSQ